MQHVDPTDLDGPVVRSKRAAREITVHVRMTAEALDRIDRQAAREERTRSDMIRVLLRRGWERS